MVNKKQKDNLIFIYILIFFLIILIIGLRMTGYASKDYQCNDQIDNDNDGFIDYNGYKNYPPDPECTDLKDNSEEFL